MSRKVYWFCLIWSILVVLYLLVPVISIIPLSFNRQPYFHYTASLFNDFPNGLSLRWYELVFSSDQWRDAFFNSMVIASISALASTFLGTLAAVSLANPSTPFKKSFTRMFLAPLVAPLVMISVGMFLFFNQLEKTLVGVLIHMFTDRYELVTIILSHIAITSPLVVILVSTSLSRFNFNLLKAARSLGAGYWQSFFGVLMRNILPGLLGGFVMAFFGSLDELVVVRMLGTPEDKTLSIQMFSGLRDDLNPSILAVATVMIAFSVMALVLTFRRQVEK